MGTVWHGCIAEASTILPKVYREGSYAGRCAVAPAEGYQDDWPL